MASIRPARIPAASMLLPILLASALLPGCPLPEPPEDAPVATVSPRFVRIFRDPVRESVADIAMTAGGDLYITGTHNFDSGTSAAMYVLKLDSAGQRLWRQMPGGPGVSEGFAILPEEDGGFVAAGATRSSGAGRFDAYLVKAGPDGEETWSRTYGGDGYDFAHAMARTADGGFALAGYTRSFGAGKMDMYLVKTDADGIEQWSQTYGTDRYESAFSVCATGDGGYALLGFQGDSEYDYYGAPSQIYLVRTDANGDMLWERTLPSEPYAIGYDLQETAGGAFIIAGDAGYTSFYMKVDAAGSMMWSRTPRLYRYATDIARIAPTRDGGFIMTGAIISDSYEGSYDVFLMKLNSDGDASWRARVRTDSDTYGTCVVEGEDGAFTVAGYEEAEAAYGAEDVFVLRARRP